MVADPIDVGLAAARFAHYAGLTLLFGALLFPVYAEPVAGRGGAKAPRPGLIVLALLALLSGLMWFAFTSAGMAGSLSAAWDLTTWSDVLNDTAFGRLWLGRAAGVVAVIILLLAPQSRAVRLAAGLASGAVLASLAWTGHANDDDGAIASVHKAADVAHLLSAGLWLGALPVLASSLRAGLEPAVAFELVSRFSRMAVAAVALLVASGALNTALIMTAPSDLLTTVYGRWLCLKLFLVALMLGFAAFNRQRLTPALQGEGSVMAGSRLRRHCYLELGLGAGVLAVVALLGTLSPG